MSKPGVDHPVEQSEAEITLIGRGVSVSSRVEFVQGDVVVVRPSVGEFVQQVVLKAGDAVEVFWETAAGRRALPAEVTDIETKGVIVRWRLRAIGPAEHGQRRQAVRGRVALPVTARYVGIDLGGETVDLSEAGLRANFEGYGIPPDAGNQVDLTIRLEEEEAVRTRAEVVRTQARGPVWLMSLRFISIEERDQDRIRRRVFQVLREERARLVD